MLAKRIIPCLDVKDNRVVKGVHFLNLRDAGDPVELGARYSEDGADELVFLDITATIRSRKTIVELVEKVAENVFIPFTVGGGIQTVERMDELLRSGAEKVSVNTAAVQNPNLITEASRRFGNQCVVLAIDARRSKDKPDKWQVCVKAGSEPTDIDAVEWAAEGERLGAGEILLTSMDADGTKAGYDIELTKAVSDAVNIPVIASGGAGKLEHLYEAIIDGGADAVLMASITHFENYTINQMKEYLAGRGIPVNL
ncbi:MAG: imidazole glycerol phosphate synthase subunit HisF [Phycisphaerae bacterium]|nr:imidazole glycerol phosphate synthase subunit HisF [Phycisphaerae bacterium]NIP52972.1 imidazole glycerol phosphate synthase subunit HisF [Phycisphaerae bacterium]NIS52942.1 imidazole glycerol phosphate synthase subunit HisF [Phycisphaerae bacterium]NIU09537.1 imidazole glycerol phosphate synthase subunit HisF [Phycisphaerae bacterium]NIU57207.1 imidazole glycerol phosphate synthase subunit HisF [Phycisphaerae bacterium]